jgi:predicted nucleotidyltransferase
LLKFLAARANREQFLLEMKQRQQAGLKIAQKCASLLKEKYGVTKVVLFGSLLNYEEITSHSDLDLAVWDLPEKDYFKAIAELDNGQDFEVDFSRSSKGSSLYFSRNCFRELNYD